MWRRRPGLRAVRNLRQLSTAIRRRITDEGNWSYASEWWGTESDGRVVLRSTSEKGNGVVSVAAFPASKPSKLHWAETERWLEKRYKEIDESHDYNEKFRVVGYEWRCLRFNDDTRQSTVKVLAAFRQSEPACFALMQQPHCLAVPYLKSMLSVGLASIACCDYNLKKVANGKDTMRVLCIGHGGGSLPLFLASKLQGAMVDIVEIDPVVISASVQAMGFPAYSVMNPSGERAVSKPDIMDEVMWKGIHERLFLYESDAEDFILKTNNVYDMIFIDAYDGEDIFPRKLWDTDSPFMKALSSRLHPDHGTVVVNLHSDCEVLNHDGSVPSILEQVLPMGKYVSQVCQAYKNVVVGSRDSGLGFTVSVPWICNMSMVVCRGFGINSGYTNRDVMLHTLMSKSFEVENILNLPFSCLQYVKRGFRLFD
ncbi:PREDICTED: uncharacterized protein LOC101314740 [Fragaria vesca subsp. vesca]|uniref:uncharacterized protein LOC101314740 n=1 Tax=Fragaria vesca subsp. vesca TaxID=101020 RepID=UPI0002C3399A|nr:PREDICTED: uncharacterized protein LOC101314740 [Fragaria vesca subsp. vesca]